DPAVLFELGAGILALRALLPIRRGARIRREADVDVDVAGVVECDVLVAVTALVGAAGKVAHDHLGRTRRLQFAGRDLEAFNRRGGRVVQVAVAETDAGGALRAEFLLQVYLS